MAKVSRELEGGAKQVVIDFSRASYFPCFASAAAVGCRMASQEQTLWVPVEAAWKYSKSTVTFSWVYKVD